MIPQSFHAIEIITDDGRGIPLTGLNLSSIGLANDGHFAAITGRPGLNGSKTITGDTTRTVWYQNILAKVPGCYLPSWFCDFIDVGNLQETAGITIAFKNTGMFSRTIETNGIDLGRRKIILYKVRTVDGITFNFKQRWTGVIETQPFTETTYKIECIDATKDLFKSAPVAAVNDVSFSKAPVSSKGKMIPLALGRVANSPLLNVSGSGAKTILTKVNGATYTQCSSIQYNNGTRVLCLYTGGPFSLRGIDFGINDTRLVDKFLNVSTGTGAGQCIRILSNAATTSDITLGFGQWVTPITLAEPLDITAGPYIGYFDTGIGHEGIDKAWFFEVLDLNPILIVSGKQVTELKKNASGRPNISAFNSDLQTYEDVSEIGVLSSPNNIGATGFPGFVSQASSANQNGDLLGYFPIQPSFANLIRYDNWTSSDLPALNSNCPKLIDRLNGAGDIYTLSKSVPALGSIQYLGFEFALLPDSKLKKFDAFYFLLDFAHHYLSNPVSTKMTIRIWAKDLYGRATSDIQTYVVINHAVATTAEVVNLLPRSYFNQIGNDTDYFGQKVNFDIKSFVTDTKKYAAFNALDIEIKIECTPSGSSDTYTLQLKEIGLVGKGKLAVSSEATYTALKGESFGSDWDGRVVPGAMVETVPQVVEKLFRDFDVGLFAWALNTRYVAGQKIRGTAAVGHIIVCTTAGISGSTEPTWSDTKGATYTDGSVVWTELQEIPIHTGSFDDISERFAAWKIGRTVLESKPTEDWYKEIFGQSFIIGLIDSKGKFKVRNWLDNTTPEATFNSSNIIPGTLGPMEQTSPQRIYNDITIRYDYNPGSGKFNKQLTVTHSDQPEFPDPNDTTGFNIDLGSFIIIWVNIGGIYKYSIGCTVAHGMRSGDYASLSGNADGYDFGPRQVSVVDDFYFMVDGTTVSFPTTSSGTLFKNGSSILAWKTYVTGIQNYAKAKSMWQRAHNSFLKTKTVTKLPPDIGDCYWYFDPYAKDPGGALLWPELDVGDEHAAIFFAERILDWTAFPKKQVTFQVEDSADYEDLEIGTCVTLNEQKLTDALPKTGWIHQKTCIEGVDKEPARFLFGLTLKPEELTERLVLDENLPGADLTVYNENIGGGDTLDEN